MSFAGRGSYGCRLHHLVWFTPPQAGATDVLIGCAHCSYVHSRLDLAATYVDELAKDAVRSSREAHARLCDRPTRRRPARAQ